MQSCAVWGRWDGTVRRAPREHVTAPQPRRRTLQFPAGRARRHRARPALSFAGHDGKCSRCAAAPSYERRRRAPSPVAVGTRRRPRLEQLTQLAHSLLYSPSSGRPGCGAAYRDLGVVPEPPSCRPLTDRTRATGCGHSARSARRPAPPRSRPAPVPHLYVTAGSSRCSRRASRIVAGGLSPSARARSQRCSRVMPAGGTAVSGGDGLRGGLGVGVRRLTGARPVLPGQIEAAQHLQQLSRGLARRGRGVPGVVLRGVGGCRRGRGRRDHPVAPLSAAPPPRSAPLFAAGACLRAVPPREAVGDPSGALHSLQDGGGGGFSHARLPPAPRSPPAVPPLTPRRFPVPVRQRRPAALPPLSSRGQRTRRFGFGFGSGVFLFALGGVVSL